MIRKKVTAVVLASMALLVSAAPAFADNVKVLGGSPEYSGNAPVISGGTSVP